METGCSGDATYSSFDAEDERKTCCACMVQKWYPSSFLASEEIREEVFRSNMCDSCVSALTFQVGGGGRTLGTFGTSGRPVDLGNGIRMGVVLEDVRERVLAESEKASEQPRAPKGSCRGQLLEHKPKLTLLSKPFRGHDGSFGTGTETYPSRSSSSTTTTTTCGGTGGAEDGGLSNASPGNVSLSSVGDARDRHPAVERQTGVSESALSDPILSLRRINEAASDATAAAEFEATQDATSQQQGREERRGQRADEPNELEERDRRSPEKSDFTKGYRRGVLHCGVALVGVGLVWSAAWVLKGVRSSR